MLHVVANPGMCVSFQQHVALDVTVRHGRCPAMDTGTNKCWDAVNVLVSCKPSHVKEDALENPGISNTREN